MRPVRAMGAAVAGLLAMSACSVSLLPATGGSGGGGAAFTLPQPATPGTYSPAAPTRTGGTIRVGTWQFFSTLSPYFSSQAAAGPVDEVIFSSLIGIAPDLSPYGDLAASVPTIDNGGVTRNGSGMDVTYHLRPGLTWSDGQPLTADDVVYTAQVLALPGAVGASQQSYQAISGVEKTDDTTVVVHFRTLDPAYQSLFPAILPHHRLDSVPAGQLATNPYWTKPDVASGPFTVQDVASDHVTLARNPHYADGRSGMTALGHNAYADTVIFRAFSSRQAVLAALKAGDVDASFDLTEHELGAAPRLGGLRVALTPALAYEQISLNQADPNPATQSAPPWAGDSAVAEALDLALDRPGLERLLGGRSPLLATPVSPLVAWAYDPSQTAPAHDLVRAKQLLDQDGWALGSDGVRVKNGVRLAFVLSGPSDQPLRVAEEQVVAAGWQRLGAHVLEQDFTSSQLFGSYSAGGLLANGAYEAALWSWITPTDPDSEFTMFDSASIPTGGDASALNYSRCRSAAIDQALARGRASIDQAQRSVAYRAFQAAYVQARCELPLYRRLDIGIATPRLHNLALNPSSAGNTWNLADWWAA